MAEQIVFDLGSQTKVCSVCNQRKPILDFYKLPSGRQSAHCRACNNASSKRWYEKNRDYRTAYKAKWKRENRAKYLMHSRKTNENISPQQKEKKKEISNWWAIKKKYGLTRDMWNDLFKSQNGVCALCKRPTRGKAGRQLAVDHCHDTGRIRGLLCSPCNVALGVLGDTIESIEQVLAYLKGTTN